VSRALPSPHLSTAWARFEREDLRRGQTRYVELIRELERRSVALNIQPFAVGLAIELTTFSPYLTEEEQAALTMLSLSTLVDVNRGSTRTPVDGRAGYEHLSALYRTLYPEGADGLLKLSRALLDQGGAPEVIGRAPGDYTPLLYLDGHLSHQRLFSVERRLAERISPLISGEGAAHPSRVLDDVLHAQRAVSESPTRHVTGEEVTLSDEQERALTCALSKRISFISGGPGTGKTSIVVSLLRCLARLGQTGEQVALAAPTGKAAWRMGESIREGLEGLTTQDPFDLALQERPPVPQTLHRLLGYHPITGRFRHHPNAPLEAEVIIVDESSMIDTYLMERLIASLPHHAQLVLLGDADQLPSVSAGAVFRDLLECTTASSARLTKSYRMREDNPAGRSILSFAAQIRDQAPVWTDEGGLTSPWVNETQDPGDLTLSGVSLLTCAPQERGRFIDAWTRRFVLGDQALQALRERTWCLDGFKLLTEEEEALGGLFRTLNEGRVLCLTQSLDSGVEQLNARFHARYCAFMGVSHPFVIGEPIMMLHNDYDRGLYNGDQGLVLWVSSEERRRPMAVFPELGGGYRCYELEALAGRVEHCYAMTVHKAQGSEFEHVALLLPSHKLPLLSKELIYTAVTRSKRSVSIVGDGSMLSLNSLSDTPRHSGLTALVRRAVEEE